ncbi:AAA domain-containing protein [Pelagophyceae sp. CCMP2097]|nr:AAA domain-containing protein [Pelagophyceae sp. CCMP2097]
MHPCIADYVSENFYKGLLSTPAAVEQARLGADECGLYWVSYETGRFGAETAPTDARGNKITSKVNLEEAKLALAVVRALPSLRKSILVITFYKAQEAALRETFEKAGVAEFAGDGAAGTKGTLRICSVDQAQGSEADVVVLSCVRSNAKADVGFLKKPNRANPRKDEANPDRPNVAVSRARERLVVVGDVRTLRAGGGKHWASLLDHCAEAKPNSMPALV